MRAVYLQVLLLLAVLVQFMTAMSHKSDPLTSSLFNKRDIKEEWEDLGWAWGKRSAPPQIQIPRRFLRALHPVKKNPDWGDLGWTWGRK